MFNLLEHIQSRALVAQRVHPLRAPLSEMFVYHVRLYHVCLSCKVYVHRYLYIDIYTPNSYSHIIHPFMPIHTCTVPFCCVNKTTLWLLLTSFLRKPMGEYLVLNILQDVTIILCVLVEKGGPVILGKPCKRGV